MYIDFKNWTAKVGIVIGNSKLNRERFDCQLIEAQNPHEGKLLSFQNQIQHPFGIV